MSTPGDYEFRSGEYDRPNQIWTCGGEAKGMACPLGPTHRGDCGAVCTPRREGERYYCNHASELAGACDQGPLPNGDCCQTPAQCTPSKQQGQWVCNRGKCQEGPLPDGSCSRKFTPCRPVRNVLGKRRLTTTIAVGSAVGLLLILTNAPRRQVLLSPGQLTSHHRATNGCKDCHTVGDGHLTDWVQAAFSGHKETEQSELCLDCHRQDVGQAPASAHGVSREILQELSNNSRDTEGTPLLLTLARGSRPVQDRLACATCHQEHQGRRFRHGTDERNAVPSMSQDDVPQL